jgi:endoglucanase
VRRISISKKLTALAVGLLTAAILPLSAVQPVHAGALSLSVSGNQLLDGVGAPIQLRGVNRSGTEYACVQGWGIFDGPSDAASVQAIASWHTNVVRVPLNEDCWLGINGAAAAYSGATYQAAIVNYVNLLHANGLYAILDLHWSAPGTQQATGQQAMVDSDHGPAFWSSVATAFKNDPAVLFDLYNEPEFISWDCWLNGQPAGSSTCPVSWAVAGMQALVNSVRAAGATQPIMVGGVAYANDLSQWLSHEPADPQHALVASLHVYNFNTCNSTSCWTSQDAPVAAQVPIVTGEIGEDDGGHGFIDSYMSWADGLGIGYLGWTWDTWGCGNTPVLISDYTGTPCQTFGTGYQAHLAQMAANISCIAPSVATPTAGTGSTTFYFAEGFTAPGFSECLAIFMPNASGQATIDYWTQTAYTIGLVNLTAGKVATVNVNQAVGPNQEVSVRVTLPAPGVVERLLHFNFGSWHGSTDIVGVEAPSTEWDFAEGSTLGYFSEYLTLQNPNATAVPASLTYMTDSGAHPTKTLTLNASSRTTVEVFKGDTLGNVVACIPSGASANCGVGPGVAGVAVSVTTPAGLPIVAERPFYVNGFGFGFAPINDGHVAFGANSAATHWYFAEGTTLASGKNGFNEYLTLQNPSAVNSAHVTLRYVDDAGNVTVRTPSINPQSRLTIEVFNPLYGVGRGVEGVSTEITSDQPIVAERPMYMSWDFGSGLVAGATDVLGATSTQTLFGFAALSTVSGNNDYLTLQNPGSAAASVTIDYYSTAGKVTRALTVNSHTRVTVEVFGATNGLGPGVEIAGVIVTSTNAVPILVEKPTYSTIATAYGATDTKGYSPSSF